MTLSPEDKSRADLSEPFEQYTVRSALVATLQRNKGTYILEKKKVIDDLDMKYTSYDDSSSLTVISSWHRMKEAEGQQPCC